MERLLISLLKKEKISSIMKSVSASYRDLHCVDVFYVKDGQYYIARSFYTDAWLAPNPIGPLVAEEGYILADSLEDVAYVRSYGVDVARWKRVPSLTDKDVAKIYSAITDRARSFVESTLREYSSLIHTANFTFVPVPMTIVTLAVDGFFLGSISVDVYGHVSLIHKTNDNLDRLILRVNATTAKSMYKEFMKCLPKAYV